MKLIFSGTVTCGDGTRTDTEEGTQHGAVFIGGEDIIDKIGETIFSSPVYVAIASDFLLGNTTFAGALRVQEGWGYSEYTPMERDELFVGPHNILEILGEMEGKNVTIWVSDESINILEGAVFNA